MSSIKAEEQLKQEWGIERFLDAMRFLSEWYIENGQPETVDEMKELHDADLDAFEIFASRVFYASMKEK